MTSGYAVKTFDKILINTVSETSRAAIVNWLVTVPQVMVLASWTDEMIENVFDQMSTREACGSRVVMVDVVESGR